jgi:hypothetical protein
MLRRTLVWVSAVHLILVIQGCEEVFTPPFKYASVEVLVTLPDGQGVQDVPLVLYTGTRHLDYRKTDSMGASRFEFVPEGDIGVSSAPTRYFYAAEHPDGYYRTFRVEEGDTVYVEFHYEDARSSIQVSVLDQEAVPVSGLEVELYTSTGVVDRVTLPESGSVLFSELTPADYGVRVLGSGFCPLSPDGFVYRDGLIVSLRQNFEIEIVLPPCVISP